MMTTAGMMTKKMAATMITTSMIMASAMMINAIAMTTNIKVVNVYHNGRTLIDDDY